MSKIVYKFLNGKITLWKSYWLVGEVLNALFILLIVNLEIYIFNNSNITSTLPFLDFSNFTIFSKITLIIWTIFVTVGIWKSAESYKGSIIWVVATFLFLSYRVFSLRLIFFG